MKAKIPNFVKLLYPRRIWNGPAVGKKLYLTFDDGPIPGVTPWVLDLLKEYNAQATFFCIGDNIRKHPEVFNRVVSDGHAVGNHTYHHLNGWKTATDEYLLDTEKAQHVLEQHLCDITNPPEVTGVKNRLFRPPYGRIRGKQARSLVKLGYKIVMWDIISMDYDSGVLPEKCFNNVIDYAQSGSIIVFHDSLKAEKNLKNALPKVLEHYRGKGFVFQKL